MKKFLVIQTAFIGDVVLATALVEKLNRHFPDAQIDFMLRKGNEALLTGHPLITHCWVWDKKTNKYGHLFNLLKKIRAQRYDKVINVQRFAATGLLTALSGAKEKIGFDKNPFSWLFHTKIEHRVAHQDVGLHEVNRNQALIAAFTDAHPERPRLYPSVNDYKRVESYKTGSFVTISPASVWYTKQYPADKWQELLDRLPKHLNVYLLGGPADAGLAGMIAANSRHPRIQNLAGQLSFLQSAALMEKAEMNYVNDSAPLHFASAMNAPVAAIYCSTLPSFGFGPLSDRRFIIEITEPLPCRPCGLHGRPRCPQKHFRCAYGIDTGRLVAVLEP